jgi:hypothetical protein
VRLDLAQVLKRGLQPLGERLHDLFADLGEFAAHPQEQVVADPQHPQGRAGPHRHRGRKVGDHGPFADKGAGVHQRDGLGRFVFAIPRRQHFALAGQDQVTGADQHPRGKQGLSGRDLQALGREHQDLKLHGIDVGEQRRLAQKLRVAANAHPTLSSRPGCGFRSHLGPPSLPKQAGSSAKIKD